MKKYDELFELIKSLSGQETRYFRLFSRHYVKPHRYLVLFDAVRRQDVYDEVLLREKFAGQRFARQLHVAKNYLAALILESLSEFHTPGSEYAKLKNLIRQVQVLYDRGLFRQCTKLAAKAVKLSEQAGDNTSRDELIEWEYRLLLRRHGGKIPSKALDALRGVQEHKARESANLNAYKWQNRMMVAGIMGRERIIRSGAMLSGRSRALRAFMRHPLFVDGSRPASALARFYYHNNRGLCFFVQHELSPGPLETSWREYTRAFNVLEKNPALAKRHREEVTSTLQNLIAASVLLKKYPAALRYLRMLERLPVRHANERAKILSGGYVNQLYIYMASGMLDEAAAVVPRIEQLAEKFRNHLSMHDLSVIYYNIALLFFMKAEYGKALLSVNRVLQAPARLLSVEIMLCARLLKLMIHFELKDLDLLPYLVRTTHRYFCKQERLFRVEKVILRYLRLMPDIPGGRELLPVYRNLHRELSEASTDRFERNFFEMLDLISWLESKISGRPFAEILREKAIKVGVRRM